MEQLAARWAHNPKVVGSSPAPATTKSQKIFLLAFFYWIMFTLYPLKYPAIIHVYAQKKRIPFKSSLFYMIFK